MFLDGFVTKEYSTFAVDSVSSEINASSEKIPPSPFRVPPSPSRFTMSPKLSRMGSVHLDMSQVLRATRTFSPSLRIGVGGFGAVYRAQLDDGQVVAIKKAKKVKTVSLSKVLSLCNYDFFHCHMLLVVSFDGTAHRSGGRNLVCWLKNPYFKWSLK